MKKFFATVIIFLSAAVLCHSAEITGGDWQGANLIPNNGDVLKGTFTNVGNFTINTGTTVYIAQDVPFVIYSSTVTIDGRLEGTGRGKLGGIGGPPNSPGGTGFGGGPGGGGGGGVASGANGSPATAGGGGGYGDADGNGISGGQGDGPGGAGGSPYGSTSTISIPLSPEDIFQGSGGGGGGGGDADSISGGGGAGGGNIYIEASYIVVTGTIEVNGLGGGAGLDSIDCSSSPAGGGGGSGGGIILKSLGFLILNNSFISGKGGRGGDAICGGLDVAPNSGGGGAGGIIKFLSRQYLFTAPFVSTSPGNGGEENFSGNYAASGSSGTVSYGIMPSSPIGFAVLDVFVTSAAYSWNSKTGAEWGGPVSYIPALSTRTFRVYKSSWAVPLSDYYSGVSASSDLTSAIETGLAPDTTVYRVLTAYTDYGDSAPSPVVSTRTFATKPANQGFSFVQSNSIGFSWSSGTLSTGFNPSYTQYEISRSTAQNFSADVSTSFAVGLSSSPSGLSPNTTYYFRTRALGINGIYTDFIQIVSTPTLAVEPVSPSFSGIYIDSLTFSWDRASNPQGTFFEAQISTDGFASLNFSTFTQNTSVNFTGLDAGVIYYCRARAINHSGQAGAFTNPAAAKPGEFTSLEAPGKPEPPDPVSRYSYDGSAVFTWYPPQSSANILRYWLEIGTSPGAKDFLSNFNTAGLSYSTNTLVSGKTYHARVRAETTAGVLGPFSEPGSGVSVWISQSEQAISKPYNWPNPFDPAGGSTNIGFYLESSAKVTLKIFTLQGAKVYERVQTENSAGNKVWLWSGRNESGSMVEPGGYVVVIFKEYAGRVETQKFKVAVLY
ncbi:MAG: hypothetical protein HY746_07885 [Elusimicrobia bacterium]|nr:hypothetical protein [Elusimicrobiota bacterium]